MLKTNFIHKLAYQVRILKLKAILAILKEKTK